MTLATKVCYSRYLVLGSFIALLLLFSYWYLLVNPFNSEKPWVVWLLHVLPLAAFIPVMKSGNPKGHAWLCFMLLLYFIEATLTALLSIHSQLFGLAYALLTVVLFTSAMLFTRWASQWQRAQVESGNDV